MGDDDHRPDEPGSDVPAAPTEGEAPGDEAAGDDDLGTAETEASRSKTTGDPDPWAGLGLRARLRARPRVVAVVSVVAVLVVVAAGVWVVRRAGEPERSPRQTVGAFFQAQRDGDCRRLVNLLTEQSWSQDGERSRRQFLSQCADAVEDYDAAVYQPRIREPGARFRIEVVDDEGEPSSDGEEAVVTVAGGLPLEDDNPRDGEGRLVREGGEWKVVTDAHILPIGRSVHETVRGYLEAYNAGDCERLLDHLSEAAWSEGGQLSQEAFLEQCDTAAQARQAFMQPPVDVGPMEVSGEGDDEGEGEQEEASAEVMLGVAGEDGFRVQPPADSVTLVRDGLEWKLDIRESRRAEGFTTPFFMLDLFELRARFVDEIATSEGPCTDHWDDIVETSPGSATGSQSAGDLLPASGVGAPGTVRAFGGCGSAGEDLPRVILYRYADDEEARAAADRVVTEALQEPLRTAEELVRPDGFSLAEAEAYVATLRPNQAATVPGLPDALAVLRSCDVDGCPYAEVLAVRNGVLVRVGNTYPNRAAIDLAADIMQAQLARL